MQHSPETSHTPQVNYPVITTEYRLTKTMIGYENPFSS